MVSALRDKVRAIDPALPLFDAGGLEEAVDSSFDNRRAVMLLLAAFAGLALFLSALGIYGVLAYDVSQRTREIGVRSAIGASRGQIAGLILRQGLWKGGIGVVLGLIGAALLSRSMTTLLFNVRPTDPAVYAAVSFVLIAVALLASYLPARRASRIDIRSSRATNLPLLILRQGLWKGGIGVGTRIDRRRAVFLSRSMTSLLFNVRPSKSRGVCDGLVPVDRHGKLLASCCRPAALTNESAAVNRLGDV